MLSDFDVIIVGSGPAGVSAAFPLLQAGLRVLMVDGGKHSTLSPPVDEYLFSRKMDAQQWKWMVGENFHALKNLAAVSPKFRAPTNKYVFDDFEHVNQVKSNDFSTFGSLATGGLSNAWGCGVASLSEDEFSDFPFDFSDIKKSYEVVSRRIGISGCQEDDLSSYFGLDQWIQPPIKMDQLHNHIYNRYAKLGNKGKLSGFRIGRSCIAVLSEDINERKLCDLSGNCLWGCHNKSLYSAADEIKHLNKYRNFTHKSGFIVDNVKNINDLWVVEGKNQVSSRCFSITASRVLLAAGTIATTRIALRVLKYKQPVPLLSSPTAAFLLWMPRFLGAKRVPAFGLGQLSFTAKLRSGVSVFGSTFSTTGIPVSEFVRHLPLQHRFSIDFLRCLLSSCVVGNAFLPGHLSSSTAMLNNEGELIIQGGYKEQLPFLMGELESQIRKNFSSLGALLLPKSFTVGSPGGDVHYAGTLPMSGSINNTNQTNALGELNGLHGLHIIDGAWLSTLTEKSHTLTIMANADRIARQLICCN